MDRRRRARRARQVCPSGGWPPPVTEVPRDTRWCGEEAGASRSAALLGEGPSPVPALVEGARWLPRAGAGCAAVPCNTAHAHVDQLAKAAGVEVLDMIEALVDTALSRLWRADPFDRPGS
ncbi:aspartate/glutamate racemase family protein [Streptomyces nigrescens]|uniref:aspartate/glutamate racemase family protein n=1 Tax=Streptomyces nigrescens TaxID=1920 RepID=UPI0021C46369|nr:aspartate/glutamate racemase family protein [Streptomyces nigrescens]